jgi:hypothetical protein
MRSRCDYASPIEGATFRDQLLRSRWPASLPLAIRIEGSSGSAVGGLVS